MVRNEPISQTTERTAMHKPVQLLILLSVAAASVAYWAAFQVARRLALN
jgi:hypothetical protein